jgi:hypothetical protein
MYVIMKINIRIKTNVSEINKIPGLVEISTPYAVTFRMLLHINGEFRIYRLKSSLLS